MLVPTALSVLYCYAHDIVNVFTYWRYSLYHVCHVVGKSTTPRLTTRTGSLRIHGETAQLHFRSHSLWAPVTFMRWRIEFYYDFVTHWWWWWNGLLATQRLLWPQRSRRCIGTGVLGYSGSNLWVWRVVLLKHGVKINTCQKLDFFDKLYDGGWADIIKKFIEIADIEIPCSILRKSTQSISMCLTVMSKLHPKEKGGRFIV